MVQRKCCSFRNLLALRISLGMREEDGSCWMVATRIYSLIVLNSMEELYAVHEKNSVECFPLKENVIDSASGDDCL